MHTSFSDYAFAVFLVVTIVVAPTGLQWITAALPEREMPLPTIMGERPLISPLEDGKMFREEETPIAPMAEPDKQVTTDQRQEPVLVNTSPSATSQQREEKPISAVDTDIAETNESNVATDTDETRDFDDTLPAADKRDFEELLARGSALITDGVDRPPYRADVPAKQLDRILQRGLARLVVQDDGGRFFLLTGTLSDPGAPHLVRQRRTLAGYSLRSMKLKEGLARLAILKVSREFNIPANRLRTVVMLRDDLDTALLASQHRAAAMLGLTLNDIAETEGSLMGTSGLPWRYRVNRIRSHDGVWHHVDLEQHEAMETEKNRPTDPLTADLRPSRQRTRDLDMVGGDGPA